MKKVKKNKKHFNTLKNNYLFLFFIMIASILLGIGYAQIADLDLVVNGYASAKVAEEILIKKIEYISNNNADPNDSTINSFYLTLMNSTIALDNNDLNSSITYKVKVWNNSDIRQVYDDAVYTVGSGYDNTDIEFTLNGIQQGDYLDPGDELEFTITFKYISSLQNITNNELNSLINFKFDATNAVARIGNTYYNTLQLAINAVPTNNTQTTVELLKDTSETITIAANKNIVLDLKTFTLRNTSNNPVITNNGTLSISRGKITSSSNSQGAINNNSTGTINISGGRIELTNNNGKQALYNDGGTVTISGNADIYSAGKQRAAVQNQAGGTMTITGGTIESRIHKGVLNLGTLTIGTSGGTVSQSSPVIIGGTYGVGTIPDNGTASNNDFDFYDGILKGKTGAIEEVNKVANIETGYNIIYSSETISGVVYQTAFLSQSYYVITFNPNNGVTNEGTRNVQQGAALGPLPTATRSGFVLAGWFTDPDNGTEVDENTIINQNDTFYAHWVIGAASYNGNNYPTLQDAIDAVPANNVQGTVTALKNNVENITIETNQNIELDLGHFTLKNASVDKVPVILNKGTLHIIDGVLSTTAEAAVLNNKGVATIDGGNYTTTSDRQVVYNYANSNLTITGGAYLTSASAGMAPSNESHLGRATVQNLARGTITVLDATIIGTVQQAISNEGTLTIGSKDGTISTSVPSIRGETYGIVSTATLNYYDGIIKGITNPISGTISDTETGASQITGTEVINNKTYKTVILN